MEYCETPTHDPSIVMGKGEMGWKRIKARADRILVFELKFNEWIRLLLIAHVSYSRIIIYSRYMSSRLLTENIFRNTSGRLSNVEAVLLYGRPYSKVDFPFLSIKFTYRVRSGCWKWSSRTRLPYSIRKRLPSVPSTEKVKMPNRHISCIYDRRHLCVIRNSCLKMKTWERKAAEKGVKFPNNCEKSDVFGPIDFFFKMIHWKSHTYSWIYECR